MTERVSGDAPERVARINLDAFRHNVSVLAALVAPAETMLAVKADAYGHGMIELAAAALEAGASSLAVLDIPAALELRAAGFTVPIFAWMHAPDADFDGAVAAEIDLGVSAVWQLERIAEARARIVAAGGAVPEPTRVHLKIDTGLHRNGATVADWPRLVHQAIVHDAAGSLRLYAAWSHLADASPKDDTDALVAFTGAVAVAKLLGARFEKLHLAASSAGIRMPEARFDFVRFGIAAYGVSPFDDETAVELGLRPVMTLVAPVVSTKRVAAGHGVSYGLDYRTAAPTTLALVPLGYADGIPRASSGQGQVWIDGTRYPVAGRVAMDQIVIDVGDAAVAVGDEVVVFGEALGGGAGAGAGGGARAGAGGARAGTGDPVPTAEEWAGWAQTIGDEIVARVGPRVMREYVVDTVEAGDGEAAQGSSGVSALAGEPAAGEGAVESWVIPDPEAMHAFGVWFAQWLSAGQVLVLTGELGAGKTTFTRGLGEGLGVRGSVTSPTFVLARTHPKLGGGVPLVHVDAYRLASAAELDDLDIDFEHSIVVVEWGAGMIENLVDGYLELVIDRPRGGRTDGAGGGAGEGESAGEAAGAGESAGAGEGAGAGESAGAGEGGGGSEGAGADADTAEGDFDAPVEPRTVTLYRHGAGLGREAATHD